MQQSIYSRVFLFVTLCLLTASPLLAQLQPATMRQIQALLDEKNSRTGIQLKMSSQLLQATKESRGLKMIAGVDLDSAQVNADKYGVLAVDISAIVTEELLAKIRSIGGKIIYASPRYHTIRAEILLTKVEIVAAYPEVKFVKPAAEAMTVGSKNNLNNNPNKAGIERFDGKSITSWLGGRMVRKPTFAERSQRVTAAIQNYMQHQKNYQFYNTLAGNANSEGDRVHRADDARNRYGYLGQGIKVGVISDSYDALGAAATDVANGDLPGTGNPLGNTLPVTVLQDYSGGGDEGRAMLQIVHDLAPKAQLFFATAFESEAGFASNIQALRSAPYNCDIIIDDIIYYDEPVFQDGIVAQAVNSVTASGGLYFSSAGNEGSVAKGTAGVWEGDFNDTGSPVFSGSTKAGTVHNFGTATAPLIGDIITSAGNVYTLTWADPYGASTNDYDLFLISSTGTVKAASTNIQDGSQDPFEIFGALTLVAGDRLVVFKTAAAQKRAFSVNTERGTLSIATTGQIFGHCAAVDAFSVAATPALQPFATSTPPGPFPSAFNAANKVEAFTSDGPRRVFFAPDGTPLTPGNFLFGTNGGTVRNKPDITAADGVTTTLPAGSGLNPFYGTSASAPHAGAIAALLKSAKPSLTTAQIRNILLSTALDIESTGFDNVSGYGILQAFQAMQAVNPTPLATLALGNVSITEGSFSNSNGFLDPGELGNVIVQLSNSSLANATGAIATLRTTTPGVSILRGTASYGSIVASGSASNTLTPFSIGVSNTVPCGTVIDFYITVAFSGGVSPLGFKFSVTIGTLQGATVSSKLGSTPPVNANYVAITGIQAGRLSRDGVPSVCGVNKLAPGLLATTGDRAFDAYTFTNQNSTTSCYTVTLSSAAGIDLYSAAYNEAGFVPANPNTNFLGDAGSSSALASYSVNVAAGKKFTVVVHSVTPAANVGADYTLSISNSVCAAGPACSPVVITNTTIAPGATGTPYTQAFSATGGSGSGSFVFSVRGNLPAGLTFSGSTLHGVPTQAGTFQLSIIASDPAGCTPDTNMYTLVIAGNRPGSAAASFGTPQSAYPNVVFAQTLQATVKDTAGNPLPGVKVIFTAPATGASGRFASGQLTDTVITNNSGVAVSSAFTANAITGSYVVVAAVNGISPVNFSLTNFCPAAVVVTSSADNGPGTLREALSLACPGVTVSFDQSVNYITLTSGEFLISRGVNIIGPGADKLTISGGNLSRIFEITAGATSTVNISGLTFSDGTPDASSFLGGGSILVNTGIVNIAGCVIANSDASKTFFGEGGAIDNEGGTVTIDRSSLINNTALEDGGAVTNYAGTMRILNSTITGNTAGTVGVGGGIYSLAALTLTNCTINGNTAQFGGNVLRDGGILTIRNTIIAGGRLIGTGGTGPDIYGAFTSADFNLVENTAAGTFTGVTTHNKTGVKPNLFPLKYYGGPTPVMVPQSNSPVINAGDSVLTAGLDQRAYARVIGGRADIGAVEVNYVYLITRGSGQSTIVNMPFAQTLQARIAESGNFIAGDTLFFTAPASGASGRFPGALSRVAALTDGAGFATSPVFTANAITGQYIVTCSIGAAYPVLNYMLTNTSGTSVAPEPASTAVAGAMKALASNCEVQLQWNVSSTENVRDFTIEYSTNGNKYVDLATVRAKGGNAASQTYAYTHTSPAEGTVYYRIRQTDMNGTYKTGDVITASNTCGTMAITAYPNPVKDKLILQVGGSAKQLLHVYDVTGRRMTSMNINGGRNEINMKGWAKGLYTVTVIQDGKIKYTVKVIKE